MFPNEIVAPVVVVGVMASEFVVLAVVMDGKREVKVVVLLLMLVGELVEIVAIVVVLAAPLADKSPLSGEYISSKPRKCLR